MKKLLAIVIVMVFVFGVVGTAFAQDNNENSNIITDPHQKNKVEDQHAKIHTGDATGGDGNWAVAANVPITHVDADSGSSNFQGQSYSSNSANVSNGCMTATANGGGNANTGSNSICQKVKQKNVINQKVHEQQQP